MRTHGMYKTRIYKIWKDMRHRCIIKTNVSYKNYGGRGITYDKKWEKFEGFYEDMQELYKDNLSLDRIKNNGNYCKSNCRWSTMKEQGRNKRNNIIYKGKCIAEWCVELGLNRNTVNSRIGKLGWSIKEALEL